MFPKRADVISLLDGLYLSLKTTVHFYSYTCYDSSHMERREIRRTLGSKGRYSRSDEPDCNVDRQKSNRDQIGLF